MSTSRSSPRPSPSHSPGPDSPSPRRPRFHPPPASRSPSHTPRPVAASHHLELSPLGPPGRHSSPPSVQPGCSPGLPDRRDRPDRHRSSPTHTRTQTHDRDHRARSTGKSRQSRPRQSSSPPSSPSLSPSSSSPPRSGRSTSSSSSGSDSGSEREDRPLNPTSSSSSSSPSRPGDRVRKRPTNSTASFPPLPPLPKPQKPSAVERLIVMMISSDDRMKIHGLYGRKLVYFTSVFVSLGVFLFGYDQGVMSGIITGTFFKDYFDQPSRAEIGTMVAILEVGAFFSSLIVGRVGDTIGRCRTILYGSIIFSIGGLLQTVAWSTTAMIVGRIIAGVGVGALTTIVPVYQSEISPPHNRGKLACIEFTGNIAGYCASVWVGYGSSYLLNDWSWRLPLSMQVVMGGLLAAGSFLIPESPRWLLDQDHDQEGFVVIANLYGDGDPESEKAKQEYREIKLSVLVQRQQGESSYGHMFKVYLKRVLIAMSAQALAQLNGINVISYYAPLVFEQAGWYGRDAILMTGINSVTYLLSSVPPWYIVDRWGRIPILLSGAAAMTVSLSLISYFMYLGTGWTPSMVVVMVMVYNASFGASWGPIPWLYPPEILPLSIRAKGASLSTATNWAFNWLVGAVTPILQEEIKWRLYLVHAAFCVISFITVWIFYPETANVPLEEMSAVFGDSDDSTLLPSSHAAATQPLIPTDDTLNTLSEYSRRTCVGRPSGKRKGHGRKSGRDGGGGGGGRAGRAHHHHRVAETAADEA